MPRIPNTPVVLSEDSYTILNGIRNTIGGEFREATPLVEDAESLAAYGEVVMGSGHWRNQYIGLIGKIAEQILLHYAYENPLKLLKRGVLEFGESVEIDWVRLTMPEGYTQSVANPGDVFKTNNPEVLFTWHPVNSQLFYETTINENEIRLCFTSQNGVNDLISTIIQRLYDSSEWDEQIVMQYLLARAYLDNKSKLAIQIPSVTKANADDIVIAQKKVSNDMRFMNTNYNIAGEPTHTPVDKQVFIISSELSAVADVGSLAKAFNLEYNKFIGRSIMVDGFSFDTAKLARLNHIMQITAAQGLIPGYTPFTEEELASLEAVKGAIMDQNFLVIYDRLVEMRDVIDARHLNVNYFLHLWKIFSYNVFAQVRYFTTEELNPPTPGQKPTLTLKNISDDTTIAPESNFNIDYDSSAYVGYLTFDGCELEDIQLSLEDESNEYTAEFSDEPVDGKTNAIYITNGGTLENAVLKISATNEAGTTEIDFNLIGVPEIIETEASYDTLAGLTVGDEPLDLTTLIESTTPSGGTLTTQLLQGSTGATLESNTLTITAEGGGSILFTYTKSDKSSGLVMNYTIAAAANPGTE